ncbi:unnamed protein product, partial [Closterium sp. NIES-53]
VLQHFGFQFSSPQATPLSTGHSLSAPPSDESVEPSGPYPELVGCLITSGMGLELGGQSSVVLTGHSDTSWVDDQATQRSSQGYIFSLGSGSVSWRSSRSSSVLGSSCEAEIYAGAMAAQELYWLTYLLTDLGERPRSPPVLYVDNKAMLALCHEQRLEHRTKHIALRYFLARELQQRCQLRLSYMASRANTPDVFTKALGSGDHQRFCTALGLAPTLPHLLANLVSPGQLTDKGANLQTEEGVTRIIASGGQVAAMARYRHRLLCLDLKPWPASNGATAEAACNGTVAASACTNTTAGAACNGTVAAAACNGTAAGAACNGTVAAMTCNGMTKAVADGAASLKTYAVGSKATPNLWHARLGHVHFDAVKRTATSGGMLGMDLEKGGEDMPCTSCNEAKLTHESFLLHDECEEQWHFAFQQFLWVVNRVHRSTLPHGVTPHLVVFKVKADVSTVRVFGCMVQYLIPEHERAGKLASKTRWGMHLGMSMESKGWHVVDVESKRMVITRDARFYEDMTLERWQKWHARVGDGNDQSTPPFASVPSLFPEPHDPEQNPPPPRTVIVVPVPSVQGGEQPLDPSVGPLGSKAPTAPPPLDPPSVADSAPMGPDDGPLEVGTSMTDHEEEEEVAVDEQLPMAHEHEPSPAVPPIQPIPPPPRRSSRPNKGVPPIRFQPSAMTAQDADDEDNPYDVACLAEDDCDMDSDDEVEYPDKDEEEVLGEVSSSTWQLR